MSDAGARAWPTEIRLKDGGRRLEVAFDSGESFGFDAEFLRVESPSAEVKGHGPGQEVTVAGKRQVTIASIEEIGNYAVRLVFSDGHSTGIYSWSTLHGLGQRQDDLWRDYLARLAEKGLTRD